MLAKAVLAGSLVVVVVCDMLGGICLKYCHRTEV